MLMESGWGFSGLPSWGLSSDGVPCRPPVSTTDQPPPTPRRAEDPRERQCVLRHELNCQLRLRPEETPFHEGGKGQARSQLDAAPHEAERTQDRQGHLLTGPSCWPAAGPAFPGSGWPGGHTLADRLQWPGPGGHLLPNLYAQATPGPHAVPPWTSPAAGTDACQPQADPAPRGPPTALGAFRSLDPEDPLTCQGALPVGTEPRTPPGIGLCARPSHLPECGSLPPVPVGLTSAVPSSCPWALAAPFRGVPGLPPPLWPSSGCTKDFIITANRGRGCLSHPTPIPGPPSGEESEAPSAGHTPHPVGEDGLSRVPPPSSLMPQQVPLATAPRASGDHTGGRLVGGEESGEGE